MGIHFTDVKGREGAINDSLKVDYEGTWSEEIEEYVTELEGDVCSEDRAFDGHNVMSHLVMELPEVAPIIEVEQDIA